jgi:hypothetical protein
VGGPIDRPRELMGARLLELIPRGHRRDRLTYETTERSIAAAHKRAAVPVGANVDATPNQTVQT